MTLLVCQGETRPHAQPAGTGAKRDWQPNFPGRRSNGLMLHPNEKRTAPSIYKSLVHLRSRGVSFST